METKKSVKNQNSHVDMEIVFKIPLISIEIGGRIWRSSEEV